MNRQRTNVIKVFVYSAKTDQFEKPFNPHTTVKKAQTLTSTGVQWTPKI